MFLHLRTLAKHFVPRIGRMTFYSVCTCKLSLYSTFPQLPSQHTLCLRQYIRIRLVYPCFRKVHRHSYSVFPCILDSCSILLVLPSNCNHEAPHPCTLLCRSFLLCSLEDKYICTNLRCPHKCHVRKVGQTTHKEKVLVDFLLKIRI